MKRYVIPIFSILLANVYCFQARPLVDYVANLEPWLDIAANSEQRQPFYIGNNPRQIQLRYTPATDIDLPIFLKSLGELQISEIYRYLSNSSQINFGERVYFEMWPTLDDWGNATWSFPRWSSDQATWTWIDEDARHSFGIPGPNYTQTIPFLPKFYNTSINHQFELVFQDVLLFHSLYMKRVFGDCVWEDENREIVGAWLPLDKVEFYKDQVLNTGRHNVCIVIPQPSRFNGKPYSFSIEYSPTEGVKWPHIRWYKPLGNAINMDYGTNRKSIQWPSDFEAAWKKDLLMLDGERSTIFPISGKKMTFTRKNSIQTDNELLELVEYLEERYTLLELETTRQPFQWRNITQSNLVVKIPAVGGSHCKNSTSLPILLADHFDTAFCEDIFAKDGKRVSAKGADDNVSASVTLLRAGEILSKLPLCNDVWLVHFTGEEFPGDDLGARYFVSELLKSGQDIAGLVLDMIAHVEHRGDKIFQINPGESMASMALASTALQASELVTEDVEPKLRPYYNPYSYLFNTDGLIFNTAGYPVILINEHINLLQNFNRTGYHDTHDTSKLIDWEYGVALAKIAIQTVALLAGISV